MNDVRESPALDIISLLQERGGAVSYSDSFVPVLQEHGLDLKSVNLDEATVAGADCVIITTNHRDLDLGLIAKHGAIIVDTRNAMKGREEEVSGTLIRL